MTTTLAGSSRQASAAWDEQIVPTLRKRLEHESAYLSNRLSASNFSELSSDSYASALGAPAQKSPLNHAFPPTAPSSSPLKSGTQAERPLVRSRTASNPNLLGLSTSNPDSPPGASPRKASAPPEYPSLIPSRSRSNTTLAAHPRPSQIPIPSSSKVLRPRRSISPIPSPMRAALEKHGRLPEAYIKDELPPFQLYPEEAMRIAKHGHDYDLEGGLAAGFENGVSRFGNENWGGEEEDKGKRKRSITMKPGTSPPGPHKRSGRSGGATSGSGSAGRGTRGTTARGKRAMDGMPRSATGQSVGLGIGHPSSRLAPSSTGRAASTNIRPPHTASAGNTPRSASLNMLASPSSAGGSRLGPAAHWVPPESTYTPPKGTDWDDVVIPSVAKKLGMGNTPKSPEVGEEGDLAVEWDKDGVPIKWVKRPPAVESGASPAMRLPLEIGSEGAYGGMEGSWDEHARIPSTKSAFSPTFEPSPENPLAQSTSSRATQPTPTPTPQKPLLRPGRSRQNVDLSPLRPIPNNLYGQGHQPPPSPAPFSSESPQLLHGDPKLGHKGSFLGRPGASPAASRQASQRSMRTAYAAMQHGANGPGGCARGESSANPRAERARDASPSSSFGMGPSGEGMRRQNGTAPGQRAGKNDTHGKGCGCVIM